MTTFTPADEVQYLRGVLDMIAESVIVGVVTLPDMAPSKDQAVRFIQTVTWGCGICQGEFHRDQDREWYDHKGWCSRAREEVR